METKNILILTIGIIVIFISLFIFTRPAIFDVWDFTETGQIGDTIGGITAPIINLIGAFLVYISFKEQILANKIQSQALADEKMQNTKKETFEKHLALFDELKMRLHSLEFVVTHQANSNPDGSLTQPVFITYKGLNALNEYINRVEKSASHKYSGETYSTHGIFLNFQFILTGLLHYIQRSKENVTDKNDLTFLLDIATLLYKVYLKDFATRLLAQYRNPKDPLTTEMRRVKNDIDKILKI